MLKLKNSVKINNTHYDCFAKTTKSNNITYIEIVAKNNNIIFLENITKSNNIICLENMAVIT